MTGNAPGGGRISFLDLGLDYSADGLSAGEVQALTRWYQENHGGEELSGFTGYLIAHDPAGFKRYRRYIQQVDLAREGDPLPEAAHLIAFIYSYACMANAKGTLYAIINCRKLGASRREILDTLHLATPTAGPFGLNAVSERTDEYLRGWAAEDDEPSRIPWPAGWYCDPEAFSSGIDPSTEELSAVDIAALCSWYTGRYGEVPPHVRFLAEVHPRGLKTQRLRFEGALGDALPVQMACLCMVQLAALRGAALPARRAVQLAVSFGVTRGQLVSMLLWAAMYGGDMIMEPVFAAVGDLLTDSS
jgi:hypothetical protein